MANLFRAVDMILSVNVDGVDKILGGVTGSDIDLGFEGQMEPCYGTRIKSHSTGSKNISFNISRWFYSDSGQEDLLFDMFDGHTKFTLEGYLIDNTGAQVGDSTIKITGCMIYGMKPRTGGPEDVITEEAKGYAEDWDFSEFSATSP